MGFFFPFILIGIVSFVIFAFSYLRLIRRKWLIPAGLGLLMSVVVIGFAALLLKSDADDLRDYQKIVRDRMYIKERLAEGVTASEKDGLRLLEDLNNSIVVDAKVGITNSNFSAFYGKRVANLPVSEIVLRWDEQHR